MLTPAVLRLSYLIVQEPLPTREGIHMGIEERSSSRKGISGEAHSAMSQTHHKEPQLPRSPPIVAHTFPSPLRYFARIRVSGMNTSGLAFLSLATYARTVDSHGKPILVNQSLYIRLAVWRCLAGAVAVRIEPFDDHVAIGPSPCTTGSPTWYKCADSPEWPPPLAANAQFLRISLIDLPSRNPCLSDTLVSDHLSNSFPCAMSFAPISIQMDFLRWSLFDNQTCTGGQN